MATRGARTLLLAAVVLCASTVGSAKPRDGAAPPGVSLEAALATAKRLQPELFDGLPAAFLPEYKAPCWWRNETGAQDTALDAFTTELRCLPAYFILGDFNCGVRDLTDRLNRHPKVAGAPAPHWWDESKPWSHYWSQFKAASARIEKEPDVLVGDSSAATFAFLWCGCQRTNFPFSEAMGTCHQSCKEDAACVADRCYAEASRAWHPINGDGSKLNTAWLMRLALGSNVKLIVMLRDPVERLHAAFWAGHHYHARYGASEEGFAAFANETLNDFALCASSHGRDECVLAFEAWGKPQEAVYFHADQLVKGAYSVFMKSWLAAFPKEDLLVLRLEDYAQDVGGTLSKVFSHLGLAQPSADVFNSMLALPIARGSHPREATPQRSPPERIDAAVRARVAAFYRPFDLELEAMLGKPGFAEWHTPMRS